MVKNTVDNPARRSYQNSICYRTVADGLPDVAVYMSSAPTINFLYSPFSKGNSYQLSLLDYQLRGYELMQFDI